MMEKRGVPAALLHTQKKFGFYQARVFEVGTFVGIRQKVTKLYQRTGKKEGQSVGEQDQHRLHQATNSIDGGDAAGRHPPKL
jgi:hypothetical protein